MTILTGLFTLGRDAELRTVNNGEQVSTLSLGYNYGRKNQDGKQPTQWVKASLWGKLAEALQPYLLKGKQIDAVLEDVHIRTYDKQDGSLGFNLEGRILKIELARGQRQDAATQAPPPPPAPAPAARRAPPATSPRQGGGSGFDDMDDDIPFRDPMAQRGFHLVA